jgi:hypothetical protein
MNTKRIAAASLWFVTGWMLGAMAALALSLPTTLAPSLGALSAILVFADPSRLLWYPRPERDLRAAAQLEPSST